MEYYIAVKLINYNYTQLHKVKQHKVEQENIPKEYIKCGSMHIKFKYVKNETRHHLWNKYRR
jgi:hypothetical protein